MPSKERIKKQKKKEAYQRKKAEQNDNNISISTPVPTPTVYLSQTPVEAIDKSLTFKRRNVSNNIPLSPNPSTIVEMMDTVEEITSESSEFVSNASLQTPKKDRGRFPKCLKLVTNEEQEIARSQPSTSKPVADVIDLLLLPITPTTFTSSDALAAAEILNSPNFIQQKEFWSILANHPGLREGPSDSAWLRGYASRLYHQGFMRLRPSNQPLEMWLEAELMDTYTTHITAALQRTQTISTYDILSFRAPQIILTMVNGREVRRERSSSPQSRLLCRMWPWNLRETDTIIVPAHLNNSHWGMAVVYMREQRITLLDSNNHGTGTTSGRQFMQMLLQFIGQIAVQQNVEFNSERWTLFERINVPQQQNGYDCGVFALQFARLSAVHTGPSHIVDLSSISQAKIPKFRQEIAMDLLRSASNMPDYAIRPIEMLTGNEEIEIIAEISAREHEAKINRAVVDKTDEEWMKQSNVESKVESSLNMSASFCEHDHYMDTTLSDNESVSGLSFSSESTITLKRGRGRPKKQRRGHGYQAAIDGHLMPPPLKRTIRQADYEKLIRKEQVASQLLAEKIGQVLMDAPPAAFIPPQPRRSTRISALPPINYIPSKVTTSKKKCSKYIVKDPSAIISRPYTRLCYKGHPNLGCAARDAHHTSEYYDSTKNMKDCIHCGANQFHSETSAKCCSEGKVDMSEIFNDLQDQPIQLATLLTAENPIADTNHFKANALTYNRLHAFGALHINKEEVGRGIQTVKVNGDIRYMLSDINAPIGEDGEPCRPLFAQRYTVEHDEAVENRLEESTQNNKKPLRRSILEMLDQMMRANHPYADAYKTAHSMFKEKKAECKRLKRPPPRNFCMKLLERRKAIAAGAPPNPTVHAQRLLLPSKDGKQQIGEIYFDESAAGEPRFKEPGILLTGKNGRRAEMVYWDPNVDPAMFPLLFPRGQLGYQNNIPLKLPKTDVIHVLSEAQAIAEDNASSDSEEEDNSLTFEQMQERRCQIFSDAQAAIEAAERDELDKDRDGSNSNIDFYAFQPTLYEQHNLIDFGGIQPAKDDKEDDLDIDYSTSKGRSKPSEKRTKVSVRQWFRYNIMTRGHWRSHHWLNWGRRLMQMYILSYNARAESRLAEYHKKLQPNLRSCLPDTLVEHFERIVQNGRKDENGNQVRLGDSLGRVFFMPPKYKGSRRYMQKEYADAQTMVRNFGAPHTLFTFTMSSEAPEFSHLFAEGDTWADRADIVGRIFIDKLKKFIEYVTVREAFGPVAAWFYSIEHQKRGLPHVHLCVTFKTATNNVFEEKDWETMNLKPEEWIDQYITAEIPDLPEKSDNSHSAQRQRDYHELVVNQMYHSCSDGYCLVDGKCAKRFPKPWSHFNVVHDSQYPNYRRRPPFPLAPNDIEREADPKFWGNIFERKEKGVTRILDNRYVVPHNRELLLMFGSHINVEWLQGDSTLEYVLKYVLKGCDMAYVQVTNKSGKETGKVDYDEWTEYKLARYITASEAFLKLWSNSIVERSIQVDTLFIHRPGGAEIIYEDGLEDQAAEDELDRRSRGVERKTKLTEFFSVCKRDKLNLTFDQVNKDYHWDEPTKSWKKWKNAPRKKLIRIGSASAGDMELQSIRALLLTVQGPTDWDDLKTVEGLNNNEPFPTFHEAAIARGIFSDDDMWQRTIQEAMQEKRSRKECIRWFAVFLANIDAKDPMKLLRDNVHWLESRSRTLNTPEARMQDVLRCIEIMLRLIGIKCLDNMSICESIGLDKPLTYKFSNLDYIEAEFDRDGFMSRHMADNLDDAPTLPPFSYQRFYDEKIKELNMEQSDFIHDVISAVKDQHDNPTNTYFRQRNFFITGDGGTGKSFAAKVLIAGLKSMKHSKVDGCREIRIMITASTGVAAELLFEGSTVHRKFSIDRDIEEDTPIRMNRHSLQAEMLRACNVIFIDEITQLNKTVVNYLNQLLKDMCNNKLDFGGKVVIWAGDFKQLLPVAKRSQTGDSLHAQAMASVKNSKWFKDPKHKFKTYRLTKNMRLNTNEKIYQKFLDDVGHGRNWLDDDYSTELPEKMCVDSREDMINFVYDQKVLDDALSHPDTLFGNALLCGTNKAVLELNEIILNKIPEKLKGMASNDKSKKIFLSIDTPESSAPNDLFAVEFSDNNLENLYAKTPSGLPQHKLLVKVGGIYMIIKNLDTGGGLSNGSRVQVVKIRDQTIVCRFLYGRNKGENFVLHAIKFIYGGKPSEPGIKWSRIQLPIRPCMAMTLNKSQGQTLNRVGMDLYTSQCFSHGQLYTGCSRVRAMDAIRVWCRKTKWTDKTYKRIVKNVVVPQLLEDD